MLVKESVCEHLFFGPNTEEETLAYFSPLVEQIEATLGRDGGAAPKAPVFTLLHPRSQEFMGICALLPIEFCDGCSLVGFQLDEPYWHQGFGTWAARFLVQHAFRVLQVRRLVGDCFATNHGSKAILERAGFRAEGIQRAHYLKGGRPVDNLLYGLLEEELDPEHLDQWCTTFVR